MADNEQAIFRHRAELYDLIYHWKDYAKEAARVRELLRSEGVRQGGRVVEAACGSGSYLKELSADYELSGFDINPAILAVAQRKVPECPLFVADMRELSLERPVDAILCLFSSIGYVFPEADLERVARAFFSNLLPGGVVVVEPWLSPKPGLDGFVSQQTYDSDRLKLCRASVHRVEGDYSKIAFHWLVTRPGGVEHFIDEHTLRLYTRGEMASAFESAGFEVRFEEEGLMPGRGLLVAKKGR